MDCLGNIIDDNAVERDLFLNQKILSKVCEFIERNLHIPTYEPTEILNRVCVCFKREPLADYSEIKIVIPTFVKLLLVENDPEQIINTMLLLDKLLVTSQDLPTDYLDANFVAHLCALACRDN